MIRETIHRIDEWWREEVWWLKLLTILFLCSAVITAAAWKFGW